MAARLRRNLNTLKRDPDNASDVQASRQDLTTLNQFRDYLCGLQYEINYSKCANDALKVIDCLRFIKINAEFIAYAFKNRTSRDLTIANSIYTYILDFKNDDFAKGVLRDFQDTSFHLNGYSDDQLQKCLEDLQVSVAQIEFAIKEVSARGKDAMLEFTQQFQYDDSVGCLDARLTRANQYIGTLLTATTPHLDELFEKLASEIEKAHLPESEAYDKAFQFFAPYIGKSCRIGQFGEELLTWQKVTDYFNALGYEPPEPLHIIKKGYAAVHWLNDPQVGGDMLPITEAHVALFGELADPNHPPLAAEKKPGDKGYNYITPIPVTLLPAHGKQALLQKTDCNWIGLLFDTRRCLKEEVSASFASGNSNLSVSQNVLTAITIAHDTPLVRLQAMYFQGYFQQRFDCELPIVFTSLTASPRLYSRQERFTDYLRVKLDAAFNVILASEAMRLAVEPFEKQLKNELALLPMIRAQQKKDQVLKTLKDPGFVELLTPAYKSQLLQAALSVNDNQLASLAIKNGAKLADDAIKTCLSASDFHPERFDVDNLIAFNRIFETAQLTTFSQAEKKAYRATIFQALTTGVTLAANAVDALDKLLWARQQSMFAEHRSTSRLATIGRTSTVIKIDHLINRSLQQLHHEKVTLLQAPVQAATDKDLIASILRCQKVLTYELYRIKAKQSQGSFFSRINPRELNTLTELHSQMSSKSFDAEILGNPQALRNFCDHLDGLANLAVLDKKIKHRLVEIKSACEKRCAPCLPVLLSPKRVMQEV